MVPLSFDVMGTKKLSVCPGAEGALRPVATVADATAAEERAIILPTHKWRSHVTHTFLLGIGFDR